MNLRLKFCEKFDKIIEISDKKKKFVWNIW